MNFPVGTVISEAPLPIKFETVFEKLKEMRFNGYIIQSIVADAVEEGVIFFREGEMIASIIEVLALKQTLKGDEALNYFLAQTKAKGFFQSVELSRSQIDLVTAFDEKLLISKGFSLKDLAKSIPDSFETKFKMSGEKSDPLSKFGLSDLKNS